MKDVLAFALAMAVLVAVTVAEDWRKKWCKDTGGLWVRPEGCGLTRCDRP